VPIRSIGARSALLASIQGQPDRDSTEYAISGVAASSIATGDQDLQRPGSAKKKLGDEQHAPSAGVKGARFLDDHPGTIGPVRQDCTSRGSMSASTNTTVLIEANQEPARAGRPTRFKKIARRANKTVRGGSCVGRLPDSLLEFVSCLDTSAARVPAPNNAKKGRSSSRRRDALYDEIGDIQFNTQGKL